MRKSWLNTAFVEAPRIALRRAGFDINRYPPPPYPYSDPYEDIPKFLATVEKPMLFDVGSNIGQTIQKMNKLFPDAIIHAFEPSPDTFRNLESNVECVKNLNLNNVGVGATSGTLELIENECSYMSSFLEPGDAWGAIQKRTNVPVVTVDEYCKAHSVDQIDFLKIDTQGYDYQVLLGGAEMLNRGKIDLVMAELVFDNMYEGMERCDVLLNYMFERNYKLVGFYDQNQRNGVLSWADVLLVRGD